jgi:kynurenine 3-monooxygenase
MDADRQLPGDFCLTDFDSATYHHSSTLTHSANTTAITVLGAGLAGALMSIFLARRGLRVTTYERLPNLRHIVGASGRSINLALADRGIHALKQAGVFGAIEPLLVPMRGRMLHDQQGKQMLRPYGREPHEVIYSISRNQLTGALLDYAERECNVEFRFRQTCISVDRTQHALCMQDTPTGNLYSLPLKHVVGADGAGSVLRRFLVETAQAGCSEEMLTHGYKELTIATEQSKAFGLDCNALHIWPRGDFMLIALPNLDGSFTATLFLPHDGPRSFASLTTPAQVDEFFQSQFPDTPSLLPDLTAQFFAHPTGSMGTVRLDRWTLDDQLVLIGDAAHAIVPFHGQGMNCGFEDCVELDALLDSTDWASACSSFQLQRKPNTDAIADMALENYIEMRDTVRDPKFQIQQALSLELERRFPSRFIPRYSMVMFHHDISYSEAFERGKIQKQILQELTLNAASIEDVDYERAAQMITERLSALTGEGY